MAKYISKFALHMICRDAVLVNKIVDGNVVTVPEAPQPIQFLDGMYETHDDEVISFLENHRHYGIHFQRLPDEVVKADPDLEVVEVDTVETVNGAVDYLVEVFGANRDKLTSKKAIVAYAKDKGIKFPNLN